MRAEPNVPMCLAALLTVIACVAEEPPGEFIVGTWVIDEAAQREEIARVSPTELEDFDERFPRTLGTIRETFHEDGRYEVVNPLGGPYSDQWELVEKGNGSITVRSAGHSWVAHQIRIGVQNPQRSPSTLTYTFSDRNHMVVTIDTPILGAQAELSFYFVREE
jgi:hypothetical protein